MTTLTRERIEEVESPSPAPVAVQAPATPKVDTPVYPGDPKRELTELEEEALDAGMSRCELGQIRTIGNCDLQVRQRIEQLRGRIPGLKAA